MPNEKPSPLSFDPSKYLLTSPDPGILVMMRFNAKELSFLSGQTRERFEREGILFIREKQDGLFRRSDAFVERFCRLRGNLLFYFKAIGDAVGEPVGVIVLERFTIQFFPSCELPHHFVVVFEDDERLQFIAAPSEDERDLWIESLHIASYECMKIQLASLRSEIRAKTGIDPITDPPGWCNIESSGDASRASQPTTTTLSANPVLEICIACQDLAIDKDDRLPNPVIVIGTQTPPATEWVRQGQTEIQEKTCGPCFLTTVPFYGVSHDSRVRVTVFDMRERVSGTMTHLGQTCFSLRDLLEAPGEMMVKCLAVASGQKFVGQGSVVIKAWQLVTLESLVGFDATDVVGLGDTFTDESDEENDDDDENSDSDATPNGSPRGGGGGGGGRKRGDKTAARDGVKNGKIAARKNAVRIKKHDDALAPAPLKNRQLCLETMKPVVTNVVVKTFRFPTKSESELSVYEYMGESALTCLVPRLLLDVLIADEKAKMEELSLLGELPGDWEDRRLELIDSHVQLLSAYSTASRDLGERADLTFKPSTKKSSDKLEFLPTNLHVQRMWVETKEDPRCPVGVYDVMTVGAFTAFGRGYKQGGLRRLVLNQKDAASDPAMATAPTDTNKLDHIREILKNISSLKKDIDFYSQSLCRAANQGSGTPMEQCLESLADKTRQLYQVCENETLAKGVAAFEEAKAVAALQEPKIRKKRDRPPPPAAVVAQKEEDDSVETSSVMTEDDASSIVSDATVEDQQWRWTGTGFVKSPTQEPWEISRLNVEASLVDVISKVEDLVKRHSSGGGGGTFNWLSEIAPLVINLQSCVNVMASRAATSLSFITVQEQSKMLPTRKSVQHRRDVCFSQALTSVVTGFLLKLRSSLFNDNFLKQLFKIGCLAVFESLISCFGDELAMLEDMVVAINDLRTVRFKIISSKRIDASPTLSGNRLSLIVTLPVYESLFALLPREIQRGKMIKIVPVLFTIGINEEATMAEKFGDTSLQELINVESMSGLNAYYEKFLEVLGDDAEICSGPNSGLPLGDLMRHLHHNVLANKSKNVDILHLAGQACREMNGLKFTSCKSAKDRTSMAVTLQQCQILQLHHDLLPKLFLNALDCMRQEGTRLVNVEKNVGFRKYAFNRFKLMTMPKLYRPPHGTYGKGPT